MDVVSSRSTVPLTVLTPLRPGGALVVRAAFWLGDRMPQLLDRLRELSFLHFATWSVLRAGHVRSAGRLRSDYLLFESDFNGDWADYLDAFSHVLGLRLRVIWGTSYGFPGPLPTPRFRAYVRRHEVPVTTYWSAYPAATTTDVVQALRVERQFDAQRDGLRGPDGRPQLDRLRDLLTTAQRDL